jgi:hypothetical protein
MRYFNLAILLFVFPLAVAGKPLFSFTVQQGGEQNGIVSSLTYPIQPASVTSYLEKSIFASIPFTLADVGTTRTITSQTDPNFDAFAASLTDGSPELITFWFVPAPAVNISGQSWKESSVVFGNDNDPRTDLHNMAIASFSLHLDALTIANGPVRSTFDSTITLSADDGLPVPEPSSCGLVLAMMACAASRRGRRARRSP